MLKWLLKQFKKKLLESPHPRSHLRNQIVSLTLTPHEIPPFLTPQNKPQTPLIYDC